MSFCYAVANGRVNDSGIWNNSSLLKGIQDGSVKLPSDKELSNGESLPYVFLGDDAVALKIFMMKPFPQQGLTPDKRIYNYRHSRRISENLFGILANRWRIFFTIINLEPNPVEDVILSVIVLHNMLIKSSNSSHVYRPTLFADSIMESGEIIEGEWRENNMDGLLLPLKVSKSGHNASLLSKS